MDDGNVPEPNKSSEKEFVLNADGSVLVDHNGKPVTVERFLCTKPLRAEVSTRKGPGGIKLSYMGGDMITKTLNEAFGYDGWSLEVKNTTREEPIKDDKGRYHIAYMATVRITHRRSGVYREDCGAGDAIDRSLASASGNALKGAVTDAMKRAARHFGEKLGNSLYHDGFNANNAPANLKDALNTLDIDRAKSRFGFEKDRKIGTQNSVSQPSNPSNNMASGNAAQPVGVKQEQVKKAPTNYAPNPTKPSYAQKTPRTQYVGNVVMENMSAQTKANAKPSHVTPHHGSGHTAAQNTTNATKTTSYVTPGSRTGPNKTGSTFDPSIFAAVPAHKMGNIEKENNDPKSKPSKPGLALPPRPGTSRGAPTTLPSGSSPTSAYIANFSESNSTPSMFAANGTTSQALAMEQNQTSIAQSLKRKSDGASNGPAAKTANTSARNPYQC